MVLDSKTLSTKLKNSYPVIINLFNVVKNLILSELEITYWFIYLEKSSWAKQGCSFEDHLLVTGLAAKIYLNNLITCNTIREKILKNKPELNEHLSDFISDGEVGLKISPKEANYMFISLSRVCIIGSL